MILKNRSLTCENGHFIARTARNIYAGSLLCHTQFKDWVIEKQAPNQEVAACPKCNAKYIRFGKHGFLEAHIAGSWVSP